MEQEDKSLGGQGMEEKWSFGGRTKEGGGGRGGLRVDEKERGAKGFERPGFGGGREECLKNCFDLRFGDSQFSAVRGGNERGSKDIW